MANFEKGDSMIGQTEPQKRSPVMERLDTIDKLFDDLKRATKELDAKLGFVSVDRPYVGRFAQDTQPEEQTEPVSGLETRLMKIQDDVSQEIGCIGVLINRLNI